MPVRPLHDPGQWVRGRLERCQLHRGALRHGLPPSPQGQALYETESENGRFIAHPRPLLIYSYIFWTYDVVRFPGMRPLCAPLPRHVYLIPIMTSVDTLFSCLTPSVLIIVLNFRIIVKIHRYQSQTTAFNTAAAAAAAAGGGVGAAATDGQNRRRSIVQTSVSASGSMHIKFSSNKICQLRHQPHHQHHQQQHQQMLQLQPLAGSHANRLSATAASVAVIPQSHPGPDRIRRLLRGSVAVPDVQDAPHTIQPHRPSQPADAYLPSPLRHPATDRGQRKRPPDISSNGRNCSSSFTFSISPSTSSFTAPAGDNFGRD